MGDELDQRGVHENDVYGAKEPALPRSAHSVLGSRSSFLPDESNLLVTTIEAVRLSLLYYTL